MISYLKEIVLFEVYDIQFVKFNQERKEGEKDIELTVNIDIDVTDKSPYPRMGKNRKVSHKKAYIILVR